VTGKRRGDLYVKTYNKQEDIIMKSSKTIGKTKIPTATHAWNVVVGCLRCKGGRCGGFSGDFRCWAASILSRYWKQWARWEWTYRKKLNYLELSWFVLFRLSRKLREFKPVFLYNQYYKLFPKKASIIAVGWMSDISSWSSHWKEAVIYGIQEDNYKRRKKGLPLHVFQFLTKDPESAYKGIRFPDNCWLGVTWTDNSDLQRIVKLYVHGKGGKKFLYIEPMETGIDLEHPRIAKAIKEIEWIVFGGENGPGARGLLTPEIARAVVQQAQSLNIPVYFKGWGKIVPEGQEKDKIDGLEWKEFPATGTGG
jgi:protein gp37